MIIRLQWKTEIFAFKYVVFIIRTKIYKHGGILERGPPSWFFVYFYHILDLHLNIIQLIRAFRKVDTAKTCMCNVCTFDKAGFVYLFYSWNFRHEINNKNITNRRIRVYVHEKFRFNNNHHHDKNKCCELSNRFFPWRNSLKSCWLVWIERKKYTMNTLTYLQWKILF